MPIVHRPEGFPRCVRLSIDFNEHAVDYESVETWVADQERDGGLDWVSAEERQRAIETDSVWVCQWYPTTPVGFCRLAASSFKALMDAVNESAVDRD